MRQRSPFATILHRRNIQMARVWEKYMGGPTRSNRDQMHITLNKKGQFTFNRKTFDELGKPKAVVFYFEKATDVIGMSSASPHLTEALPVKEIQNGTCYAVYGAPFCRKF